jgi:light-regulated signal transduction histidine kinase (bacteriophytochrome)
LLTNAFKYSSGRAHAHRNLQHHRHGCVAYTVRDNGVGFNMKYYDKLFGVFQRLHGERVSGQAWGSRSCAGVVSRLDGRVWAEACPTKAPLSTSHCRGAVKDD